MLRFAARLSGRAFGPDLSRQARRVGRGSGVNGAPQARPRSARMRSTVDAGGAGSYNARRSGPASVTLCPATVALTLHAAAKRGPVVTKVPALAEYLAYWLAEVIKPNREPNTYSQYELFSRRYILPGLGTKRIDRLTVRDVQMWLNKLPGICQCCAQGKGTRTSGLLDANQTFCVFLRRPASREETSTCEDCR